MTVEDDSVEQHDDSDAPVATTVGHPSRVRTVAAWALAVGLIAVLVVGVLLVRGWRPWHSSSSNVMPTSPQIEQTYGIRFTAVGVTAGGGMIMLRYQVLDSDKTAVVHDQGSAPYVIDQHGNAYKDPGIVGHTHIGPAKAAGTSDFVLLANAHGGVQPGQHVTIHIGSFELKNVPVV